MKPSYRLVLAVLVAASGSAFAQPPAEPPIIVGPTGPPPGPVRPPLALLLDDFRIVDGDVRKTADGYEVHRGKEIEKIPAKRVLFAGESLTDVELFLKARAANPANRPSAPSESMKFFAAKVQPVLTNSCTNCHARPDHASRFRLVPVPAGRAEPYAIAKNATTATALLDPADLANSPLLVKAVTAHGGQRMPSLHGRTHPAFRNLEMWARMAVPAGGSEKSAVPTAKPPTPITDPFDPGPFNRIARAP